MDAADSYHAGNANLGHAQTESSALGIKTLVFFALMSA